VTLRAAASISLGRCRRHLQALPAQQRQCGEQGRAITPVTPRIVSGGNSPSRNLIDRPVEAPADRGDGEEHKA